MEYIYADGSKLIKERDDENKKTIYTLFDENGEVISNVESFDEEQAIVKEIEAEKPEYVQKRRMLDE